MDHTNNYSFSSILIMFMKTTTASHMERTCI